VFGKPVSGGVRIDIPLSQQQLGSMVGMSRESMNKQLKQWRQEGLIRVEEGHYILTDLEALHDL
jgi:CRP-like cAMP-binding protein